MSDENRTIELEVEVSGTVEEVWQAIATGPGISSWYVPHEVDGKTGGVATAAFGAGPEMKVTGRVAAWEPPKRVVFDGGEGVYGLAFEWLVEPSSDTSCVVKLVNTGFGSGQVWDEQFDGMTKGWGMFLQNLRLHMENFPGQVGTPTLPTASWPGPPPQTWAALLEALDVEAPPKVGQQIEIRASTAVLAGTVTETTSHHITLLLDQPNPGTAFVAVEGQGDSIGVSIWSYLYGAGSAERAKRDEPLWQEWLNQHGS